MSAARATRVGSRLLVLALLTAIALLGWHAPAALADDAASCQSSGGVYVYIQPGGGGCSHVGGNGMTILRSLTSVNTNSTGMICQIGGYPSTCPDPAPANDYWAYWDWNGTKWVYSNFGAAADWPNRGDVRAWTFGNTVLPTVTPARPANPATTTTTPTTTTPTSPSSRATTSSATISRHAATRTTSTTRASAPARTTTTSRTPTPPRPTPDASTSQMPGSPSPASTPSPAPAASGTATPVAVIITSPTSAPAGGTPWGAMITAGLVVLGGAGIVVAKRRR